MKILKKHDQIKQQEQNKVHHYKYTKEKLENITAKTQETKD